MVKSVGTIYHTEIVTQEAAETNIRKRVGILGGTFNPPHIGHLVIADQVHKQLDLDKIYFMPSFLPPHVDEKEAIAADKRVEMVEKVIKGNNCFDIEKTEIKRGGKSYTFDTMDELTKQNPDTDYYFIIGGDMIDYLPKWYRIEDLLKIVQFVGIKRPGYSETSEFPILWVDTPQLDISSTYLRTKIAQGCSVNYLIPENVLDYIEQEGLYREKQ